MIEKKIPCSRYFLKIRIIICLKTSHFTLLAPSSIGNSDSTACHSYRPYRWDQNHTLTFCKRKKGMHAYICLHNDIMNLDLRKEKHINVKSCFSKNICTKKQIHPQKSLYSPYRGKAKISPVSS